MLHVRRKPRGGADKPKGFADKHKPVPLDHMTICDICDDHCTPDWVKALKPK